MSRLSILAALLLFAGIQAGHAQDAGSGGAPRPVQSAAPQADGDGDADDPDLADDTAQANDADDGGAAKAPSAAPAAASEDSDEDADDAPAVQSPAARAPAAASDDDEEGAPANGATAVVPAAAADAAEPVTVAPGVVLPGLAALSVTRERPLFSPGRRPPPPPEVAEAEPPPPPPPKPPADPPFELAGIVAGGDLNVAMLRNRDTQAIQRAKAGEQFDGWTLAEIGQRYVVLQQEDRSVRLAMFEHKDGELPRRPPPKLRQIADDDGEVEDGFRARQRRHALEMRKRAREAARQAARRRGNRDEDGDE